MSVPEQALPIPTGTWQVGELRRERAAAGADVVHSSVIILDAPPTIGHNIQRAVDERAREQTVADAVEIVLNERLLRA